MRHSGNSVALCDISFGVFIDHAPQLHDYLRTASGDAFAVDFARNRVLVSSTLQNQPDLRKGHSMLKNRGLGLVFARLKVACGS